MASNKKSSLNLTSNPGIKAEASTKFTREQVYFILCHFVYPPCRLDPGAIRMFHNLETDLGYVGAKDRLVAKTNAAFSLQPPNLFSPGDFGGIDTVREHHTATCGHLRSAGRLI